MSDVNQVIPHSIDAEKSVLGGLLVEQSSIDIIGGLNIDHFFDYRHKLIFRLIRDMNTQREIVDVITVLQKAQSIGVIDEVGGLPYLNELASNLPSTKNLKRYAEIVEDLSKRRGVIELGENIKQMAFTSKGKTAEEVIADAQTACSQMVGVATNTQAISIMQLLAEHTKVLEDREAGNIVRISTGLPALDDVFNGGLEDAGLTSIGARPGMGKTAAALEIALHIAKTEPVAFISMEMGKVPLSDRIIANLGRVNMSHMQNPKRFHTTQIEEMWSRTADATEMAREMRFHLDVTQSLNIGQLALKARYYVRQFGCKVIFIDYLQLMRGRDAKMARTYQLEEICQGLLDLKNELNVHFVLLAQVNRTVKGMPDLGSFKDSGSIEQFIENAIFLHRPIIEDQELPDTFKRYMQISVAKQRQGEAGLIDATFIGEHSKIQGWDGKPPQKPESKKGFGLKDWQ